MKELICNQKFWKVITVIFLILSVAAILTYIISKPVHVDEGWIHSVARAKNIYGYYTFIPFHDIPHFENIYTLSRSLSTQFFRVTDLLFKNPITAIKTLRLLFLIFWSITLFLYIKKTKLFDSKWDNILLGTIIIIHPMMFRQFGIARPEIAMSALLLFLFLNYHRSLNRDYKLVVLLSISTLLLLFHPNGILYMLLLMIISIGLKHKGTILKLWVWVATIGVMYYLIFIDANRPLYTDQYKLIFFAGAESKFCPKIKDLPKYLLLEIQDRYLMLSSVGAKAYPIFVGSSLLTIIAGLIGGFKNKKYKIETIYVVVTMLFFVLLGNKTWLYLAYIIPILVIMASSLLSSRMLFRRIIFLIVIAISLVLLGVKTVRNFEAQKKVNEIVNVIEKEVKSCETIYAPFSFEPYLSSKYNYLTTTQKSKNNFYEMFDIHPHNCVIIAKENNEIWKWAGKEREKIREIDDIIIQRVN